MKTEKSYALRLNRKLLARAARTFSKGTSRMYKKLLIKFKLLVASCYLFIVNIQ